MFLSFRFVAPATLLAALCSPLAAQAPPDTPPKLPVFALASIHPNNSATQQFNLRFTPDGVHIENASLLLILRAAYGMFNSLDDKFIGVPAWPNQKSQHRR